MARRIFYSFHYLPDCARASQIRNMGVLEGNKPATDNDWEDVKEGGDKAIQNWIDNQLAGRTCTVILIGANTAGRKWIDYEIRKSWNDGKGVVGIYIHNLKDLKGNQSTKGNDPFSGFTINDGGESLSNIVKKYNPPRTNSKAVYKYINDNISDWIEEAITIRTQYVPKGQRPQESRW